MTASARATFAEVVRESEPQLDLACLLIAAEVSPVPVDDSLAALDALAAQMADVVTGSVAPGSPTPGAGAPDLVTGRHAGTRLTPALAAEALRVGLGERAGFAGFQRDYADLRASLLPDVLRRRRGLPILLAVVWVEVARRLSIPAHLVGMPGHVLVGVGPPGPERVLVDPFAGGRVVSPHQAAARVRAGGVDFRREHLDPTPARTVLLRVLTNIRALAERTGDVPMRLWAVELSLLLPSHPVSLRREHAEVLVAVGDFLGGSAEYEHYAAAIEPAEPAAADRARVLARQSRARLS